MKNQRFNIVYDEATMTVVDASSGSGGGDKSKLKRISYFSDFIFMQQLMTIEIDVILGNTKNGMKHLGKHTNDDDEDDDKKKKKEGGEEGSPEKKC